MQRLTDARNADERNRSRCFYRAGASMLGSQKGLADFDWREAVRYLRQSCARCDERRSIKPEAAQALSITDGLT